MEEQAVVVTNGFIRKLQAGLLVPLEKPGYWREYWEDRGRYGAGHQYNKQRECQRRVRQG